MNYLGDWLILRDDVHDVMREPRHVFADDERKVPAVDDLVVEDGTADLFHSPFAIDWRGNNII